MKIKKALVLGSGGLNGAYSAGFMSELCRQIGPNYFDSVYCYSVGSTIGSFYVANQPEIIEKTWKNYVDGTKLIKPYNFFIKKPILDLDYLISLFKKDISKLNIKAIVSSKVNLNYIVVNYHSGKIFCLKPNKNNILNLIKAACSLPIVHGPSKVGRGVYFDAAFVAGGLPFLEEIVKKHDKILIVLNFPLNYKPKLIWWPMIDLFFPIASYFYPKLLREVFKKRKTENKKLLKYIKGNKKIKIITPSKPFLLDFGGDADKKQLRKLIKLGKDDAKNFLRKNLN